MDLQVMIREKTTRKKVFLINLEPLETAVN